MVHRVRPLPLARIAEEGSPAGAGAGARRQKAWHPLRYLGLPPALWRVVQDYCQQSSLHGLKYISREDLPYIERYLWLAIFLACVGFSVKLIYEVWQFWVEQPFLITFDSHVTPIWAIPFPSVTLCSYFAIKRSVIDLAKTNNRTTLFYASLLCPLNELLNYKAPELENVGNDFFEFVKQASPVCSDVLKRCSFWNKEVNCCDLFDPILTESGLCFIFNNLPLHMILSNNTYIPFPSRRLPAHTRFWTLEDGYPRPDLRGHPDSFTYPLYEQLAGEDFGLSVELYQNTSEWQQMCSGGFSGFKMVLANPATLPVTARLDLRLSMSRETNVMVSPSTLGSHAELASVAPSVRACVFRGERPLRWFTQYTESNCYTECLALHYVQLCGCVPFYYPREERTRICSRRKDKSCLQRAKGVVTKAAMESRVRGRTSGHACDCLKGCQQIIYHAADFYTDFVHTGKEPLWAESKLGLNEVTRVSVYFKSNQFLGRHRSIQYTNLRFAGTCGGLLSLLLGFSVISAIELLYAFLLRPFSRIVHAFCEQRGKLRRVIKVEPYNDRQHY